MTDFVLDDGGRKAAGFRGTTGDCVVRAIAVATGLPYREVYDSLYRLALNDRPQMARLELRYGKNARRYASPRTGVVRRIYDAFLRERGWVWYPTNVVGSGCKVHLTAAELPEGRLIVRLSRHVTAVIDGAIHDTYDPSRDGTRCVYGYWQPEREERR